MNWQRARKMMGGRLFGFWILAGVSETLALYEAIGPGLGLGRSSLMTAFLLHLLAALVYFLGEPRGMGWIAGGRYWSKAGFMIILFLPFFGWLSLPVMYFVKERSADFVAPTDKEEDLEHFLSVPKPHMINAPGETWRERVMKELDFMPLADILAGADDELKRGAIERLATLKTPESIALLMAHRSDPSPEVRFFVTAALARVKKDFDEQLDAAKLEMQKNIYKVSARVFLAKIYLQYVRSGLLDGVSRQAFENEAIYHLEYASKTEYARPEVFEMLSEVRAAREEWPLAFQALEKIKPEEVGLALLKRKVEILFLAGRYREMVGLLAPLREDKNADSALQALARWWCSS